jgi:glucose-1-phosphate thymidylyltransferase|nr:MAG TPA: glucose-1-phosphate thymidylyltransferase, short form [Caudoviricetes sp.]
MKGIILAGGSGTRLYPVTKGVSKQLLPVYDKPMIYYPLSILMLADIREVLIITTAQDQQGFINLLGNGKKLGVSIEYAIQDEPKGLAEAFIIGENFIGKDDVALILGDNLFYAQGLTKSLREAKHDIFCDGGASIFIKQVKDPDRFGVVVFDEQHGITAVEEKPLHPKSDYAVTGLYFYDNTVVEKAKAVIPSARGELEITDINQMYIDEGKLCCTMLSRGSTWLDTGTHESLMEASQFVYTVEKQQGFKIACLEEIAYDKGWIGMAHVLWAAHEMRKTEYGEYLLRIIKDKI